MRRQLPRVILDLALFLALGALFFALTFPADRLAARINASLQGVAGGALAVEDARYRFPFSLRAQRLMLVAGGRSRELGRVTVTPRLLTLFGGERRFRVLLDGKWGELPVELTLRRDGSWAARLAGGSADLALHPALEGLPVALGGKSVLSLDLSGVKGTMEGAAGAGTLAVTDAQAAGKKLADLGVGTLAWKRVSLAWSLENGILTLKDGRVEGDLGGTLSGTVRLAPRSWASSALSLAAELKPAPGAALPGALALLAGSGSLPLRVGGTLGAPQLGAGEGGR
jgi:type II secretion system protein N